MNADVHSRIEHKVCISRFLGIDRIAREDGQSEAGISQVTDAESVRLHRLDDARTRVAVEDLVHAGHRARRLDRVALWVETVRWLLFRA